MSVAQIAISPVGAVIVVEGNNLTITCSDGMSSGSTLRLREDRVELTGSNFPLNTVSDLMRTFAPLWIEQGTVKRTTVSLERCSYLQKQ